MPWETLAEDREAILLADRLGFAEAFVGEHVTDLSENVTSSPDVPRQRRARNEAHHARHGHASTCRTRTRPTSRRRSRCSTTCSRGGFILGISPGGLMSDAEVFGNYEKDRNAIFLECIDMVLEIWKRDGRRTTCTASTSRSRRRRR